MKINYKAEDTDADNHFLCAIVCLFQFASRQCHHSNHLKVSEIPVTLQTREALCGTAFRLRDFHMTSVLLTLQSSFDTPTHRNANLGKLVLLLRLWIGFLEVFKLQFQVRL